MRTATWPRGLLLSAVAALLPAAAQAAELGAIVGLVTNAAGAPVAHATITAQRLDGSAIRATISGSDGVYSFADVPPGTWSISSQIDDLPEVAEPPIEVAPTKATQHD